MFNRSEKRQIQDIYWKKSVYVCRKKLKTKKGGESKQANEFKKSLFEKTQV